MKDKTDVAIKITAVINSCMTPEHIAVADKLVTQFERLYDSAAPLRGWLLSRSFQIKAAVTQ